MQSSTNGREGEGGLCDPLYRKLLSYLTSHSDFISLLDNFSNWHLSSTFIGSSKQNIMCRVEIAHNIVTYITLLLETNMGG